MNHKQNHPQQSRRRASQSQDDAQLGTQGHDSIKSSRQGQTQIQRDSDDLDAVLDDIETTLQSNAEEYVSRFVQKGGE